MRGRKKTDHLVLRKNPFNGKIFFSVEDRKQSGDLGQRGELSLSELSLWLRPKFDKIPFEGL